MYAGCTADWASFEKHWKDMGGEAKTDKPLYSGRKSLRHTGVSSDAPPAFLPYFMGPTDRPATGKFVSMGAFSNCTHGDLSSRTRKK